MLKKAGIVVAAAAAGLLAVSPLAFATDGDDHEHDRHTSVEGVNSIDGSDKGGLINLGGNNISAPINACGNQVPVNVLGVQVPLNGTDLLLDLSGLAGGLGVLGEAETESDVEGDNTVDESCNAVADTGDTAEIDD